MTLIRINPAIPMISPKGPCLAHFLIDNGIETDICWVCFQDNTGECRTWSNKDIRAQKNVTAGSDCTYLEFIQRYQGKK